MGSLYVDHGPPYEPVAEKHMWFKGNRKTPCQIMRDIYLSTTDEGIRLKSRIVTRMLKIMITKINELEPGWERKHW